MQLARLLACTAALILIVGTAAAQEFPIAVGADNTFGGGGAFDGTNFLFAVLGDAQNKYNITAQRVSATGELVGQRIQLGHRGSTPLVAFDGARYLVVWSDSFPSFAGGDTNGIGNIYGQFISTAGVLVGSRLTFVTGVNIKFAQGRGSLVFQDTSYFLTYLKGPGHHSQYVYGQRISRSGIPLGSPVQISNHFARECAVAFDGTNYLVAWCRVEYPNVDKDIYAQFINKSGALVGTNFVVDATPRPSDNPVSMIYDGSKYWVSFHEQASDTLDRWNLYARFVSTSGGVSHRIMICDSTNYPTYASAGFDGRNYLISWMEFAPELRVRGRYFTSAGVPLDTPFTLFASLAGKYPLGGVAGFVNGRYLLTATRTDMNFTNGDVYGKFLPASPTGVQWIGSEHIPTDIRLFQNYPNPFNPATEIEFQIGTIAEGQTEVTVRVHDLLGREVTTLVNEVLGAGKYKVRFNASGLSGGMYYYTLRASGYSVSRKMILLR